MTMPDQQALDTLACELDQRPAGAPSFDDLAPALRGVERLDRALALSFDPAASDDVEALAAAERLCCAGIGFAVEQQPALRLIITAAPEQLAIFEQLFTAGRAR